MESTVLPEVLSSRLPFAITITVLLVVAFYHRLRRPQLPQNVPVLVRGLPIIGSWDFFTKRLDFWTRSKAKSTSGSFSFWAGSYPVIGLTGEDARKVFFDTREFHMGQGYRVMLGGQPGNSTDPVNTEYFNKRLTSMLKGNTLRNGIPQLVQDIRTRLDKVEKNPSGIIEPFKDIYEIVFQLTIRTVGCNEIANDPATIDKMLHWYETIEASGDKPLSVMYPALWTIDTVKRTYAGFKLYTTLDAIIKDRKNTGRREEDALQFCLDQGDTTINIVEFILGALFAGQLNSGINGAWLIVHLSRNRLWRDKVLDEIRTVANRYAPDSSIPLREKLALLPGEAWETEFPIIDLCLKDAIRLNLHGTAFRRNIADHEVSINKAGEVVPSQAFVAYHVADTHLNPDIYPNPEEWNPARYLPDRAEDTKERYAWWGWGVGRHPCLGMRFAKLEANMITAFWMAYFESEVVDEQGNITDKIPRSNFNANTAKKPLDKSYVKYRTRNE